MENERFADVAEAQHGSLQVQDGVLTYTGRSITRIPEVFWKLHGTKIQHLDLSYNSISNLHGLEGFKILNEFILDNNEISDTAVFPYLPTLKTLSLNNNRINDLPLFIKKVKSSFPNLAFLSILGNKACPNQLSDPTKDEADYQRYRYFVLHHLKKLKFLDSAPVTRNEQEQAAIKGQFMEIRKPRKPDIREIERSISEENWDYTPLPNTTRPIGEHRGAYATYKLRYTNKESEGNRFIVNNDL